MRALAEHLTHHGRHMLACLGGAAVMVVGFALSITPLAIVGAVVCGVGCLSMIRMVATRRHAH